MALKAIVESLDSVDEKYHDLYSERDGKFYLNPIEGMKSEADVLRLQSALTKERAEHKVTKGKLESFGDLDPEEVLSQLDRISELEEAAKGKLDENQLNNLVETRLKSRMAPLERRIEALTTENSQLLETNEQFVQREKSQTISQKISAAAQSLKVIPEALDDVLLYSSQFEIDESGNVVTKESLGSLAGLDPEAWFRNVQDKKPHWFGPTEGAGTRSPRGGRQVKNPWSKATFNLTEQGRITMENPELADQLKRSAVN